LWGIDVWLCAWEDVWFFLLGTIVIILADFKLYFGMPRWYAYGAALGGAILYRVTIGRLVMGFSERMIRSAASLLRFWRDRVLLPMIRCVASWGHAWMQKRREKRAVAYTDAVEASLLASLEHFFNGM
jgi:hypothetical protein